MKTATQTSSFTLRCVGAKVIKIYSFHDSWLVSAENRATKKTCCMLVAYRCVSFCLTRTKVSSFFEVPTRMFQFFLDRGIFSLSTSIFFSQASITKLFVTCLCAFSFSFSSSRSTSIDSAQKGDLGSSGESALQHRLVYILICKSESIFARSQ